MDYAAYLARSMGVKVEDYEHWVMVLPYGMGEGKANDFAPGKAPFAFILCDLLLI